MAAKKAAKKVAALPARREVSAEVPGPARAKAREKEPEKPAARVGDAAVCVAECAFRAASPDWEPVLASAAPVLASQVRVAKGEPFAASDWERWVREGDVEPQATMDVEHVESPVSDVERAPEPAAASETASGSAGRAASVVLQACAAVA